MEEIAKKYDLDLDEPWNKEYLPHQGRHPDAYHEWVLNQLKEIDELTRGDKQKFLDLYEERVKKIVRKNPDMLRRDYWE